MKKNNFLLLLALCFINTAIASYKISESPAMDGSFPLIGLHEVADVWYDENDYTSVKKVIDLFIEDVQRVSGKKIRKRTGDIKGKNILIIGTVGNNSYIDRLIDDGQLSIDPMRGGWEQYTVKTIDYPMKNVSRAIVIAGIDRRGTAYGVLDLSKAIGVSPLYWWSDVPVEKHRHLYIAPMDYVSPPPAVKYRGIFINDEGWGITPWAKSGLDSKLSDIGPCTYEKVCELLLRLKANMLAPAMHPSSGAFNKYPENAKVADDYGVIITTSHCEPLLFNNTTEWDSPTMGDWNYISNREGIIRVLDQRVATNHKYENIYTIAMRGIHDAGLVGVPKDKEVELVEQVISDQRGILKRYINSPIDDVPQIFVPYKEVLDIYEKGLNLPEDITLVWPDDNFGYIKRLNNSTERCRSGGSGVYYHISYLGEPHDYLWLNTTPPALIWEEMSKAYNNGADRYWLLNVGDIKPGELGIATFMDMAWDINQFNSDNINSHQTDLLCSIYGEQYRKPLQFILETYYKLGFQHKPEAMGWGWEWNSKRAQEKIADTDFSITNYGELEKRLESYRHISDLAHIVYEGLPEDAKPSFFEMVYYPVKGAYYMNQKMLKAQLNRWHAVKDHSIAKKYALESVAYADSIVYITDKYNSLLNGKWKNMMSLAPGWVATYQNLPPTYECQASENGKLDIAVSGGEYCCAKVLQCQSPLFSNESYFDLFNKGQQQIAWAIEWKEPWLKPSANNGYLQDTDRIYIDIDWDEVPEGVHTAVMTLNYGESNSEYIIIPIYQPSPIEKNKMKGLFVENNGYVCIDPALPHRIFDRDSLKIFSVKGLGYEGESIQLGHAGDSKPSLYDLGKSCRAEYDFYSQGSGSVTVHTYALPVFPLTDSDRTRFGIMIDEGDVKYISNDAKEYSGEWKDNVMRNACVRSTTLNVDKPGKHTLKLICADPGMIIQKIVIDFGGLKRSYLGPRPTFVM